MPSPFFYYVPGVGVALSAQSAAVSVSVVKLVRMMELPSGDAGTDGLKAVVLLPQLTASTVVDAVFSSQTMSPPLARPFPIVAFESTITTARR